jgi:hypothetical protein
MAQQHVTAAGFRAAVAGGQEGDGGEVCGVEVLPEDPGPPSGAAAADDLLAGHDRVQAEVMCDLWWLLVWYLQGVDGAGHHDAGPDQAGLDPNANSRSEKPPPLPTRAPSRLTATLPQTTRSTGWSSATPIRRPESG